MRCWKVSRLIIDYKNGLLSEEANKLIEEHISRCEKCRKLLDWHKALDIALFELEPIGVPQKSIDESWAKIKREINRRMRTERLPHKNFFMFLKRIFGNILKVVKREK